MSDAHVIYGFHAVLSRIRQNPEGVQEICVDKERSDARMNSLLALAKEKNLRVMQIERARLALLEADTATPDSLPLMAEISSMMLFSACAYSFALRALR